MGRLAALWSGRAATIKIAARANPSPAPSQQPGFDAGFPQTPRSRPIVHDRNLDMRIVAAQGESGPAQSLYQEVRGKLKRTANGKTNNRGGEPAVHRPPSFWVRFSARKKGRVGR